MSLQSFSQSNERAKLVASFRLIFPRLDKFALSSAPEVQGVYLFRSESVVARKRSKLERASAWKRGNQQVGSAHFLSMRASQNDLPLNLWFHFYKVTDIQVP